jgi:hypothetical protein
VIHAAQRAAPLVIRNGGASPVAERVFDNILRAHGQDAVETVWRLDFIAASRGHSGEGAYLRNVGALTLKLALVGDVEALAERAMAEEPASMKSMPVFAGWRHCRRPVRAARWWRAPQAPPGFSRTCWHAMKARLPSPSWRRRRARERA